MENNTTNAYERAKKRVDSIKIFYSHLFLYIFINIISLLIWLFVIRVFYETIENQGFKNWIDANFLFFTGVWTLVVVFHGLRVFYGNRFIKTTFSFFKNWEERKINQFMEAEEKEFSKHDS